MIDRVSELSEIQKRCLRLVAANHTSKEIAIEVGLSPMTVDQYLSRATASLGVSNRRYAARILVEIEAQQRFNQFEFKPDAVGEPQFSANVEAPPVIRRSPDHPVIALPKRMLTWVARHIGGTRHDLSKLETIRAILWTALATSGVLAGIITISYWLNDIFR